MKRKKREDDEKQKKKKTRTHTANKTQQGMERTKKKKKVARFMCALGKMERQNRENIMLTKVLWQCLYVCAFIYVC